MKHDERQAREAAKNAYPDDDHKLDDVMRAVLREAFVGGWLARGAPSPKEGEAA